MYWGVQKLAKVGNDIWRVGIWARRGVLGPARASALHQHVVLQRVIIFIIVINSTISVIILIIISSILMLSG